MGLCGKIWACFLMQLTRKSTTFASVPLTGIFTPEQPDRTRGGWSHFFRLRSCSKILIPGQAIFQIWEFSSCSQSGYNHRSNRNLPMNYLRNDDTDSCFCRNQKVTPGTVFHKFLTPNPVSSEISDLCKKSDFLTPDPYPINFLSISNPYPKISEI